MAESIKTLKKILSLVLINVGLIVLLLLLIEGVARIVVSKEEGSQALFNDKDLRVRDRPFVVHHPTRGFALKPGFHNDIYSIDENGFRGQKVPDSDLGSFTILALGESTTFGWGVDDNETYPYFLMQNLKQTALKPNVVNGGVPSYTSSQVRVYLSEILERKIIQPDLILISIMWNDIWYSTIENWNENILIYQKPSDWIVYLNKYSHFFNTMMKILSEKTDKVDRYNEKALLFYAANLASIAQECQKHHIPLVFIEPPFDADHMPEEGLNEFHIRYSKPFFIKTAKAYHEMMHKVADQYGIPVISHRLGIQNLHQKPLFMDALHPASCGNKIMADDIAKLLQL